MGVYIRGSRAGDSGLASLLLTTSDHVTAKGHSVVTLVSHDKMVQDIKAYFPICDRVIILDIKHLL